MIRRTLLFERTDMRAFIHESNLIENIDDVFEDSISMEAWCWLKEQPRMSRDRVLALHRFITYNQLPPEHAGKFRKVPVWVGGRACPQPYVAVEMMLQWLADMRSWKKLDPKEMHVRFEHIHPFIDGNGRTGRMLMWWHEMMLGQEPTLIRFSERGKYYGWF